jgi:hypothetical protein
MIVKQTVSFMKQAATGTSQIRQLVAKGEFKI